MNWVSTAWKYPFRYEAHHVSATYRWHIDCFRCNTCGTLLDSDANLLLLGDGSLICSNCTYSCSACGDKIEDLAILTGDQAYCAGCFRCRNCKRKIENLRYARTSQGMFCMECHDGLMARRRKKTSKSSSRHKQASNNNSMLLDKSLPSLPPSAAPLSAFSPDRETPPSDTFSETPTELPGSLPPSRINSSRATTRDRSPAPSENSVKGKRSLCYRSISAKPITLDTLTLPASTYKNNRNSGFSYKSEPSEMGDDFYIPMALDPNTARGPSPLSKPHHHEMGGESAKHELPGDYFTAKPKSSSRKTSKENRPEVSSRPQSEGVSQPSSPRNTYQEKTSGPALDVFDAMRKRKALQNGDNIPDQIHEAPSRITRRESELEKFKLQEAPKRRKSGSQRTSRGDVPLAASLDTLVADPKSKSAPASAVVPLQEQQIDLTLDASARSSQIETPTVVSPHLPQDSKSGENQSKSPSKMIVTELSSLPKRGDSLQKSAPSTSTIHRKDIPSAKATASSLSNDMIYELPSPMPPPSRTSLESPSSNLNGGKVISRPIESPIAKSTLDFPPRSKDRPVGNGTSPGNSFVSPRAPPQPPSEQSIKHKARNGSISTLQSEATKNGEQPGSPGLPRYQASGDFSMKDEMTRIMGTDEENGSIFHRVSKSVRHARSQSDRGNRLSKENKWSRTSFNETPGRNELSSSALSSPEAKDEIAWYKNELRKTRQKVAEKEEKIAELESTLEGKSGIKKMNTELSEKRSTMVVLDTQKEIVVRELEILTDHIAAAKKSREPLNVTNLEGIVLREFAESLQKLKDSYTPQIEELTQQRNELADDIVKMTASRDRIEAEFEQLAVKNAQLAELNNTIVDQVHAHAHVQAQLRSGVNHESSRSNAQQGLGIYNLHSKGRSNPSIDSRDPRPSLADSSIAGSTLNEDQEGELATIVNAPKLVPIQKGNAKKTNNWKTKAKGIRGVLFSNESKPQREGPMSGMTEGTPYGAMSQSGELPSTTLPKTAQGDPSRQAFGRFGQKSKAGIGRVAINGQVSASSVVDPSGKIMLLCGMGPG